MAAAEVDSWRIYDVDDPDPGYFEFDWISARFPDLYDRFAISTSVGMEELCCLIDLEGLVVVDVGAGTGRSAIAAAGGRGVRGIIQVLQVLVDLAPSRRARGEDFQIAQHVTASGDPRPDVVRVKTYRDVLGLHATHSEPKNLGPDGQPCTRSTRGLLSRRPITASTIELIGKESHRLEERTVGLIGELSQVVTTYPHPEYDAWAMLVLPVLATTSTSLLADRTGLDARTIQRLRKGESWPHPRTRAILTLVAVDRAERQLRERGFQVPEDAAASLASFLNQVADAYGPTCPVCSKPVNRARAVYCSEGCKKRAYRARKAVLGVEAA